MRLVEYIQSYKTGKKTQYTYVYINIYDYADPAVLEWEKLLTCKIYK